MQTQMKSPSSEAQGGFDREVVLSVRGLRKTYGDAVAVDDISFDLHRGEFLTLLGESGSGKSTTLMMIAGFETPTAGSITLEGKDLTRTPAHKRGLGVVFQNYALFPNMSVADNVAYPLRMRGVGRKERRERAMSALDLVKLTTHADHFPAELSGGQQQRVALARALVFDPAVLLMDEPLGALDKKLREHLQAEIRMLHRDHGVTVIYVTHDQVEALTISDRIAVMRDGKIEQLGDPHEIYASPSSSFVADFVGEGTLISGVLMHDTEPTLQLDADLTIPIRHAEGFAPGARLGVMVRPESAAFADPDVTLGDGLASMPVVINDKGYYGRDLRYECIQPETGIVSIVRAPETAPYQPEPGERATVVWNPDDGRAFAKE